MPSLQQLREFIARTRQEIDMIYAPIFVVQATNDEVIETESANIIYNQTESLEKHIKWYENSKHVITLDQEKINYMRTFIAFRKPKLGTLIINRIFS